jgi:hypothetical protein
MTNMRLVLSVVAVGTGVAVSAISLSAHADSPFYCAPKSVYVTPFSSSTYVRISFDTGTCTGSPNSSYYAFSNMAGCSISANTVMAYSSMAQAALFSGKTLMITWHLCSGIPIIDNMAIQ